MKAIHYHIEYDFSNVVRSKNHKPLHKGYSVNVVSSWSLIELAKQLPGRERYRGKDKSARQAAESWPYPLPPPPFSKCGKWGRL